MTLTMDETKVDQPKRAEDRFAEPVEEKELREAAQKFTEVIERVTPEGQKRDGAVRRVEEAVGLCRVARLQLSAKRKKPAKPADE